MSDKLIIAGVESVSFAYPDNAPAADILAYCLACLSCHSDETRIMGNLRVVDLACALEAQAAELADARAELATLKEHLARYGKT